MTINSTFKIKAGLLLAIALWSMAASMTGQQTLHLSVTDSEMNIKGTSTIHDWDISVKDMSGMVTGNLNSDNPEITDGRFKTNVENLKSEKKSMDKVVHDALEKKEHPVIRFNHVKTEKIVGSGTKYMVTIIGNLTIAGETRQMKLDMNANQKSENLVLQGTKTFKMSLFNIDPPSAMLGTIKSGDEITIEYSLTFK